MTSVASARHQLQYLPILPREFYVRPTVEVARGLLGQILVHGRRAARIVEVEAYLGLDDKAAHASRGITPRTRVLFGQPGHAYVYLIYGMYECLNLEAEPDGTPGCVLIRAVEPLCGITLATNGPGKLTRALDITRRHYGRDVTQGSLTVRHSPEPPAEPVLTSPRIGIRDNVDWPLRFYLGGNAFVSKANYRINLVSQNRAPAR
jgi:DNA-3-methyladenine glycosylase